MKIGIFADIHGNIYAFKKVFNSLRNDRLDLHIFCGDICGYYYYQNEVIEILKKLKNLICVRGNHDEIFLKTLQDYNLELKYTSQYGKSYSLFKKSLIPESLEFLKELPKKYIAYENKIGIFHGSPWKYLNEYVYSTDSFERFKDLPFNIVLLGHTHYPMYKKIGNIHIINPGSCGQPRDINKASYAIFDLDTEKIEFKRLDYNTESLIRDVKRKKEENFYLSEVLKRK